MQRNVTSCSPPQVKRQPGSASSSSARAAACSPSLSRVIAKLTMACSVPESPSPSIRRCVSTDSSCSDRASACSPEFPSTTASWPSAVTRSWSPAGRSRCRAQNARAMPTFMGPLKSCLHVGHPAHATPSMVSQKCVSVLQLKCARPAEPRHAQPVGRVATPSVSAGSRHTQHSHASSILAS